MTGGLEVALNSAVYANDHQDQAIRSLGQLHAVFSKQHSGLELVTGGLNQGAGLEMEDH